MRIILLLSCMLLTISATAQRYTGGRYSRVRIPAPTRYRQYHSGSKTQQDSITKPESTHQQSEPTGTVSLSADQSGINEKPGQQATKQKAVKRINNQ